MRKALDNRYGGISLHGRKIKDLRYADDTLLIASSAGEITELKEKRSYGQTHDLFEKSSNNPKNL